MRAGLTASAVLHVALIVVGVVGLHGGQPLEPEEIESIAIDLVPVEAFSNIRAGTLESDVIETDAPSVVDTPEPAQLAERTGNTEEDQPKPEVADTPTPAPTVQTAPEPAARVEPEPEPQPEPEPVVIPEPQPEPEPAAAPEPAPVEPQPVLPDPVLAATPDVSAEPKEAVPQPVIKTASIDQKRAEFKRKQEEEAKQRAAERAKEQAEKAKEADRISDIINAEDSRGGTTGTGGQATAGKPTGQASRLTQSERDALAAQMRKCWNPPLAALSEPGLTVRLIVDLNRDGSVAGTPRILSQITSPLVQTTAMAAQRAVMRCGPYRLAADKYDEWNQVDVTFDPRDL